MTRGSGAIWVPLACLLVGLGAGYLLFREDGASLRGTEADLTGDAPSASGDASTPRPLHATTLDGGGTRDPLVAVMEAEPVPAPEAGQGTIQGRVTDAAGEAVAGVHMTLSAVADANAYPRQDPQVDPDVAMLKYLRHMIQQHRWGSAYRQVTTTDADGRYRFESVTARKHRVEAQRDGYQIQPRDHRTWQGVLPDATLDFLATPMARLRLELLGTAAPTSLDVQLRNATGSTIGMQWSPSRPVLDCQPGTWDVSVSGGTQGELRAGPYPLVLVAGAEPQTIRVELEVRPVLRLHLKFAPDEVMPVFTYMMPSPAGGMPTATVLRARGKMDMRRWINSQMLTPAATEHVETFNDLEEGAYVVGIARTREGALEHMEEIVLTGGVVDHTIQVPPLEADSYIMVSAYGPDGALVKGAQYSTGVRSETSSSSGRSETALRRDGRVLVMHQDRGEAPGAGATWWVDVTVPNLGSKRVEYVRGAVRELRVDFQEPAEVSVEVKGVRGTPYEGRISVGLHPGASRQRGGFGSGPQADKDGVYVVRGIQPGDYVVSLQVQSGDHRSIPVAEVPYTVRTGRQTTAVTLPALYTLTVRGGSRRVACSTSGKGGARVHLSAIADDDGVAMFDALPAGTYTISADRGRAEVTLPGPSEITLTERSR